MELLSPPRANFLCFRKRNPKKMSYIFLKESFAYISGNGNPKKLLIFQKTGLSGTKLKKLAKPVTLFLIKKKSFLN